MLRRSRWFWLSTAVGLTIGSALVIYSCSGKSSSPTSPGGGGGGLELSSGNIPSGGVFQHTFNTAGSFPYHCTIHAIMTGNMVTVSSSSANDSAFVMITGSGSAPGFSPSSVTIKTGGHVRWLNLTSGSGGDGLTHTVTSGS